MVEDNGKGFDTQKFLGPEGREKGMGLAAMEERSRMIGGQMTNTSAIFGNDVSTLTDYSTEIRAPAGDLARVSGFHELWGPLAVDPGGSSEYLDRHEPGSAEGHIDELELGGVLIVNEDTFVKRNLARAGYSSVHKRIGQFE